MQMPLMLALDTDRDGEISAEEIKNAVAALKKLDRNGDGRLSREELRPQFGGPGGPGQPGPGAESFVERLMAQDKNGDGTVSKEEMPEWMQQRMLERVDTNQDGAIDKAEAQAAAERMGRGRGGPPREGGRPRDAGGDRPRRPDRPRQRPEAE